MCENENVILKLSSETCTPIKMARSMSIKMQSNGRFHITNLVLMEVAMRWLLTVVV